jgi:hypothetical protein
LIVSPFFEGGLGASSSCFLYENPFIYKPLKATQFKLFGKNEQGGVFDLCNFVGYLALLIVNWMSGYPLARIISNREKFYRDKESFDLQTLIRGTMKDVEEIARFQAPKYLACYGDLLRVYFEQIDRQDLLEQLLEMNILLEFGVSQTTQLSLMGIGLSRSSAIAVSEFIADDSLNKADCLKWLKENDWMTKSMPELIKREISNLLKVR